jgi:hypothetical protein
MFLSQEGTYLAYAENHVCGLNVAGDIMKQEEVKYARAGMHRRDSGLRFLICIVPVFMLTGVRTEAHHVAQLDSIRTPVLIASRLNPVKHVFSGVLYCPAECGAPAAQVGVEIEFFDRSSQPVDCQHVVSVLHRDDMRRFRISVPQSARYYRVVRAVLDNR